MGIGHDTSCAVIANDAQRARTDAGTRWVAQSIAVKLSIHIIPIGLCLTRGPTPSSYISRSIECDAGDQWGSCTRDTDAIGVDGVDRDTRDGSLCVIGIVHPVATGVGDGSELVQTA